MLHKDSHCVAAKLLDDDDSCQMLTGHLIRPRDVDEENQRKFSPKNSYKISTGGVALVR